MKEALPDRISMKNFDPDNLSPVFCSWHDSGRAMLQHSSDTYGQRTVRHYEIEYIVDSHSGYIITDNLPLPTVPHSVFFRSPGMVAEGIGVYRSYYIQFDLNAKRERSGLLDGLSPFFANAGHSIADAALFQALHLPENAPFPRLLLWKSDMLRLLSALCLQAEASREHPAEENARSLQPVRDSLSYIHLHYKEPVTLRQLSDCAGYSSCYFSRLFKRVTQLSPMQYVVRYRLEQAKKMLLFTNAPLETVMLDCGFHNYGYFWKSFKEIYGVSPNAFRKELPDFPKE